MQSRSNALALLLLAAVMFPAQAVTNPSGDYDGDGKSDVFWRNTSNGLNTIWKSANHSTPQVVATVTSQNWKLVGDGDFDGDGRSDLFWRNSSTGDNLIWKSANAAMPQLVMRIASQDWKVAAIGDFDGDGESDIFWRNSASGANRIWISANAATPQSVTATSLNWTLVGDGDFNGDGKSDVFWRNTSSGANRIWLSGNALTPQAVKAISSQDWKAIAFGDFDGDGRSDVFWRNVVTGANRIWKSGDANTPLATAAVTGAGWVVIGAGDFDGDGRSDVFWRNLHSGTNMIWKAANASASQAVATVSNPDWIVVPRQGQVFSALFITDVSIIEGNNGTRQASFKVRLSQASASPVTYSIDAHDDDVSNTATAGSDYVAKHLTGQTIAAGETSKVFTVTVNGDTAAEANETFRVVIYEADAPIIYDAAIGKILNDDANALWIADARTIEGDSGTKPLTFTIRLSRPSSSAVTYDIATADYPPDIFAATAGKDYVARSLSGQVIPAGATSHTFTVSIIGDTVREIIGEHFKVIISNVAGAAAVDGQASGMILDDEEPIIP